MKHAMSILYVIVLLLFATMTAATAPMNSESELEHFTSLADDDHTNQNFVVSLNSSDHVIWNLFQSDGMYWDFEVTDPPSGPDQIITFFICDQENYDFWISGESASVYHLQENVTSYSSEFTIPYTDTWHFVFRNYDLYTLKTINFDLYRDKTAPTISMSLNTGATYSGTETITASITEEQFAIETVQLSIDGVLKDTEHDDLLSYFWDTTQYSNGAHTIRITASDTVGNSNYTEITVYVSNSDADETTGSTMSTLIPIALGAVGLIAIIGIVIVASRRGKGSPASADMFTSAPPPPDESTPAPVKDTAPADAVIPAQHPSEESESMHFREREIITERFLVICPFCGAKNQQGLLKCQKCDADL